MDNVYQPPKSNLQPSFHISEGFGQFDFSRAFELAQQAFSKQVGVGVGFVVVLFMVVVVMALTLLGIPFGLPILFASMSIFGYRMIRQEASVGDLFSGFNRYFSVLMAVIILTIATQLIILPLNWGQYSMLLMNFPIDSIGNDDFGSRVDEWAGQIVIQKRSANYEWFSLLSYFTYPVSLYLGGRFILLYPLIIIRKMGIVESFKTSWKITAQYQWWLMLLQFVSGAITGAGVLFCCVGVLFSIPFGLAISGAAVYQLFGEDQENQKQEVDTTNTSVETTNNDNRFPY
ncbi:MAG: glycerophosphoryl diester phosphodiesterase membrane domain-containing protein [Leptonema sp. (in: Bacteria)]|nr:glycerophosphoryl diester phosphodiesterase membrane domain-containing protein [Leptonema sp. (in: bacteria)]